MATTLVASNMKPKRSLAPLTPLPSTPEATPTSLAEPSVASPSSVILQPAVSQPSIKLPSTSELYKRKFDNQHPHNIPSKKVRLTAAQSVEPKQTPTSAFHVPNLPHVSSMQHVIVLPPPPSATSATDSSHHQFCISCGAARVSVSQRFCGMCGAHFG